MLTLSATNIPGATDSVIAAMALMEIEVNSVCNKNIPGGIDSVLVVMALMEIDVNTVCNKNIPGAIDNVLDKHVRHTTSVENLYIFGYS